jgi:hypothetical protein
VIAKVNGAQQIPMHRTAQHAGVRASRLRAARTRFDDDHGAVGVRRAWLQQRPPKSSRRLAVPSDNRWQLSDGSARPQGQLRLVRKMA